MARLPIYLSATCIDRQQHSTHTFTCGVPFVQASFPHHPTLGMASDRSRASLFGRAPWMHGRAWMPPAARLSSERVR
eukprot:scaffold47_cov334-Pavlova_lutheri.AAC.65